MEINKEKITAVVVTYNRKKLLEECLQSLLKQTRPLNLIILIDNASTDGTSEFLEGKGYLNNPKIDYVRLEENTGGAGGFYEGVKRGYEKGFDWLWLMDDDGYPESNVLEILTKEAPCDVLFRGPLVLAREDSTGETLAFGWVLPDGRRISTRLQAREFADKGLIWSYVNPYNGVIIHRSVIESIGLPIKDFFIWGDETEYYLRALANGIGIATITLASFWHPKDRMKIRKVRIPGIVFKIPYSEDVFRNYLIVRNGAYIAKKYYGIIKGLKFMAKMMFFGKAGFWCSLRYSLEGFGGNLERHKQVLRESEARESRASLIQ